MRYDETDCLLLHHIFRYANRISRLHANSNVIAVNTNGSDVLKL